MPNIITANWNAPKHIKTLITTKANPSNNNRTGAFNLATHIQDDPKIVATNRSTLNTLLPAPPYWLNQIHSNKVLNIDELLNTNAANNIQLSTNQIGDIFIDHNGHKLSLDYDAGFSYNPNTVCAVMTADCVPILLTDTSGSFVAAIHAGRMGLATNIISNAINTINKPIRTLLAYIGPAICQKHYEVGTEVFNQFIQQNEVYKSFFSEVNQESSNTNNLLQLPNDDAKETKYLCDLVGITQLQLFQLGIFQQNIYLSNLCTYCNNDIFYSYRKEKNKGRFASLIWIEA